MDVGIITLPLRVGFGGARVMLRTAASATGCAAKLGGRATVVATRTVARVSDTVAWGRPAPSFEPPAETEASVVSDLRPAPSVPEPSVNGDLVETPRTSAPRGLDVAPPVADGAPPVADVAPPIAHVAPPVAPAPEPEPAPPVEPAHVSEEPELVSELAEPGAEDGAGAAVTVAEPWPGYARMTAKQVIERLADATPAELAAVQLYESIHRDRQTVRAAAERNMKSKTGRGSPD